MKFRCPNCKTAFKVEDSKIPEKGIHAHCPKCQSQIWIKKPAKPQEDLSQQEKTARPDESLKKCPFCGEYIQKEAIKCRFCGEWLPEKKTSEQKLPEKQFSSTDRLSIIHHNLRKYKSRVILAIFIEYLGQLGIILGNTEIIAYAFINQLSLVVLLAGIIILLIYTYRICEFLGFGMLKRLLVSFVNACLLLNIPMTIGLIINSNKKIKILKVNAELMQCPSCKAFHNTTVLECPNCGYDLSKENYVENKTTKEKELRIKLSFLQFLRVFFSNYSTFLKKHLISKKPPFFFIMIWLLGMSSVIGRIETKYIFAQKYNIDNWAVAWAIILIGGIISGYLGYWIGGALYHLRVWISSGAKHIHVSRKLYLYTGLPIYLIGILLEIVDMFIYGNKYFTEPTNNFLDLTWSVLSIIGIIYSITLSYRGVRLLQDTKLIRSIIFFIVLPAIFYSLVLGGISYKTYKQYSKGINYNEQALELYKKGNYEEAEKLFKQALFKLTKDEKEDIRTIYENLALLKGDEGQTDEAIKYYQKALSLCELEDVKYNSILGKTNVLKGNIHEAINNFEESLKINPDNFYAHNHLGLIFLGDVDDKIQDYERALFHNKRAYSLDKNATTMKNLAMNYYFLNRDSDALPLFDSLNTISPNDATTKYFMGLIYYSHNDLYRAKIFLREAVALNPKLKSDYIEEILLESTRSFEKNLPKIVKRIQPSVVTVIAYSKDGRVLTQGSGFFIDKKGHLVTNYHVLKGAYAAEVTTYDGKKYPIELIVAENEVADLIKVLVDIPGGAISYLKIAKDLPSVGERIIVVGSPVGLEQTVSEGIVSAIRKIPDIGVVLQITAPISLGSSGSPVVSMRGEVFGVASLYFLEGQNLNFAIAGRHILDLQK